MWQAADGSGQAEVLLPFREERPTTVFARVADASMEAQPIAPVETDNVNWRIPLSWSPDGKVLAFEEMHPQTGGDIGLLKVGDETTVQPFLHTPANDANAVFSPDGEWLAYDTDESGQSEVYVLAFPSGRAKQQVSTGGGYFPAWNPSGGELFYRNGNNVMVVDVRTNGELVLGKPRVLFEKLSVWAYDVTRDGQRFVMVERSEAEPPPTQLILVQNWAEELKRLVPTDN
jgi:dipeptidyl aminopeptidase/acylaminoacyl peptidase